MARPSPADPLHSRVNSRRLEFVPRLTPWFNRSISLSTTIRARPGAAN